MKKSKRIISIKSRTLVSILTLIGLIFLVITVSFNILVNSYIHRSYNEKLKSIESIVKELNQNIGSIDIKDEEIQSQLIISTKRLIKERKSKIYLDPEIIIVDEGYNLISYQNGKDSTSYINNIVLVNHLKERNINLNSNANVRLETKNNFYYLKSINLNSKSGEKNFYLIVAIDISATLFLFRQINILLVAIMIFASILAVIISVVLSKKIANPIQEISEFAKNIGKGDFSKCDFNFKDRELVELAEVMNKAAEDLYKYDSDQKIFFQNVSHELRTPLMSIKGYAEAIKYNVLDKESASEIILEESNSLEDLIEELLYISRMNNITKDYKLVDRDLREILSNCIVKRKIQAINKNIEFKLNFDENPVILSCDEKSIFRAFLNIIENSLRYAKKEINIECLNKNEYLEVTIENDGEKLAPEEENKIFERFYKGKGGKHGIGLSIVKSVIEKHKGTVIAENSFIGVKFIIKFKISK